MFFLFWTIFLFLNFLFIIGFLFFYYLLDNFYEILWKIFYILISYILTLLLFLFFSQELFFVYLSYIGKLISIRDPQEYVYFFVDASILISFIVIVPNIFIIFHLFLVEIFTIDEYFYYKIIILNLSYIFLLTQWLFIEDFLFFHWEIFLSKKRLIFDFQPDLYYLYSFYKNEYLDLVGLLYFINILLLIFYLQYFQKILIKYIFSHLILNFSIIFFGLYFFGGETLYRDLMLLILSLILGEFFLLSNIFFYQIQKLKKMLVAQLEEH